MNALKSEPSITQRFDRAASGYDEAAAVQAEVAEHLVGWAMPETSPKEILDIGAGTGLVTAAVAERWPSAVVTALDSAPGMLDEAQRKVPQLNVITGDAAAIDITERYDAIFCSMVVHWLPEPRKALQRWSSWLKPGGNLYVALLIEGSFREWTALCMAEGVNDGLWLMPRFDFARHMVTRAERRRIPAIYPSALEFLRRLKATGASTPRDGHTPLDAATMRRVLRHSPKPFIVSYDTLYIELPSSLKI